MTLPEKIQAVQAKLGVKVDGKPGSKTWEAIYERICNAPVAIDLTKDDTTIQRAVWPSRGQRGKASSFADPDDIEAFRRAKARGLSDKEAFAFGDNGVGCWGDDTTDIAKPYVAVTPDDMIAQWGSIAKAKHKEIDVTIEGVTKRCVVGDRMPWKKNVKNGAVIDLAPGAQLAFDLKPPFKVDCSWSWV